VSTPAGSGGQAVTVRVATPAAVTFLPAGAPDVPTVGAPVVQPAGDDAA
jgi:hypothetical protein